MNIEKPEIENLKAWIYGKSTTGYQRALGMREFEKLLEYVTELEQLRQPSVISSVCPDCAAGRDPFEPDWKCPECRRQTDR